MGAWFMDEGMIKVQKEPFDTGAEINAIIGSNTAIGAIASFTGTVRDISGDGKIETMTLEHYPGMTEKALEDIEAQAKRRWPLQACIIIHRYGALEPGDPIVLVITASAHRKAAFEACEFLMDWLKTKAPFWKLEEGDGAQNWVEARGEDDEAAKRWAK